MGVLSPKVGLKVNRLNNSIFLRQKSKKYRKFCATVCSVEGRSLKEAKNAGKNCVGLVPLFCQGSHSIIAGISTAVMTALPATAAASPIQLNGRDFAIVGGMLVAAIGGFLSIINKAWRDSRDQKLRKKANQLHQDFMDQQILNTTPTLTPTPTPAPTPTPTPGLTPTPAPSFTPVQETVADIEMHTRKESKKVEVKQDGQNQVDKKSQYYSQQSELLNLQLKEQAGVFEQVQKLRESVSESKLKQQKLQQHIQRLQIEVKKNAKADTQSTIKVEALKEPLPAQAVEVVAEASHTAHDAPITQTDVNPQQQQQQQLHQLQQKQELIQDQLQQAQNIPEKQASADGPVNLLQFKEKTQQKEGDEGKGKKLTKEKILEGEEEGVVSEQEPEQPSEEVEEEKENEETKDFNQQNISINYSTGWSKVILHGSLNGGDWCDLVTLDSSETEQKVLNLDISEVGEIEEDSQLLQFVLTNGEGDWDNNNNNNYHIQTPGNYVINNGELTPKNIT